MGLTTLVSGDTIPLVLQLFDGATDQFPQAELWNLDTNVLIDTKNLVHRNEGLYSLMTEIMPNSRVAVTYIIYSDAGHTTENLLFERKVDTFTLSDASDSAVLARKMLVNRLELADGATGLNLFFAPFLVREHPRFLPFFDTTQCFPLRLTIVISLLSLHILVVL